MQQKKADETRKGAQEPEEELELFRKALTSTHRQACGVAFGQP